MIPRVIRARYHARLSRDTTIADVTIVTYATGPDSARTFARERIQKIGAVDHASVK